MKRKIDFFLKNNKYAQVIYRITMSNLFKIIGLFVKTDENMILFVSFSGKAFNDSPKKIYEEILDNEKYKNYNCIWAFEDPSKFTEYNLNTIKIDTFKYFYTALKAKYWVSSVNIERGLHFKKSNTIYLNTWHATPVKKAGNALSNRKDFDFSNVNYLCCSSAFEKEVFIRDFNAKADNIIMHGLPRNDILYSHSVEDIMKIRENLNIPKDKKIILYAPTWRESTDKGNSYSINSEIDIKKWEKELKEEYVLLFKSHVITNKVTNIYFNDFIKDVSNYQDINELLLISDILISDYSSTMIDYSILERPIISFAYDYDMYKAERGFYFDIKKELPNGIKTSDKEVLDHILKLNYSEESKRTKKFKEKYTEVGGEATKKCVEVLLD